MNLFTRNSPYYHLLKYLLFLPKHPVDKMIARWDKCRNRQGDYGGKRVRCVPYYLFNNLTIWYKILLQKIVSPVFIPAFPYVRLLPYIYWNYYVIGLVSYLLERTYF